MELSAITDESWMRHVDTFKPVETFALDDYFFELYVIDEIGYPINYLYRLLCYKDGIEQPILSLNTEFGPAYIYFHAATIGSKQMNLGMSAQTETLDQFRNWAFNQLTELLPQLEKSKLMYIQKKGLQLNELKKVSEFELRRMEKSMSQLVELSHEFMFPFHFDEPKDLFETSTIPILNVKLLIMETKQGRSVGAILFPKKDFLEEDITKWLYSYGVYYVRYTGGPVYVDQCDNVLFSFLADGYVLVVYLKGKERKQVQHIFDTSRRHDDCDEVFWGDLDLRIEKAIYLDEKKIMRDQTIELAGDLNIVHVNGMTLYADRVIVKDGVVSFMHRQIEDAIALVDQFSEMHIELSELEYHPKKNVQIQKCYIEYERII